MKTHYAQCDRGNECNPDDEWGTTYCGLEYYESPATDNEKYVTCKNCLRVIANQKKIISKSFLTTQEVDKIRSNTIAF